MKNKKSVMWEYISQEKQALNNLLTSDEIDKLIKSFSNELEAIYFVCHGSSFNGATSVSNFIACKAKLRVYCYTPANFLYNCNTFTYEDKKKVLIVGISQTGTSSGTLRALQFAKDCGFQTLGITSIIPSPLSELSTYCLDLKCGEENSNAKTKGYSATITLLLLWGLKYAFHFNKIDEKEYNDCYKEISASLELLDEVVKQTIRKLNVINYGKGMSGLIFLSCGMNYGTALEGQIKLMETMCVPTMFNDLEEFSHGMHRSVKEGDHVVLINSGKDGQDLFIKTFKYLLEKGVKALLINAGDNVINHARVINLSHFPNIDSIITITTVIQVLSVFVPELNGLDPNRAANDDYPKYVKTRVDQ